MSRLDLIRDLRAAGEQVSSLLESARLADGRSPLSDQLWLDLEHGGRPGSGAALARGAHGQPVAYAQVSVGNDTSVVQLVVDPAHRTDFVGLGVELLRAVATLAADGSAITWWVSDPTDGHRRIAEQLGWRPGRRLLQMRRPLPIGLPIDIQTRAFRPGHDDDAWLAVNNRAFADHGEQGGWDRATLAQRIAEPWFDPTGFLVHERAGRMAGFCWTKLHHDLDPVEGEIYVIAVDPDFHGLGLGVQLTLAGLESIEQRGVHLAMLYVDADNTAAVSLYEKLGFTIGGIDVAYVGTTRAEPTTEPNERQSV